MDADLSVLTTGDKIIRIREKTPFSFELEAKFIFSFVSSAKPGKHFLIETDEEDGQQENGSAKSNDYAGEFLFYRTCLAFQECSISDLVTQYLI